MPDGMEEQVVRVTDAGGNHLGAGALSSRLHYRQDDQFRKKASTLKESWRANSFEMH